MRFRGVRWKVGDAKWEACIKTKGRTTYLGLFTDEAAAARAYDAAARELRGAEAQVNFPRAGEVQAQAKTLSRSAEEIAAARAVGWRRSRFRGVRWKVGDAKWEACIKTEGRTTYLGLFTDEAAAARAYDAAARELRGAEARVNFPRAGAGPGQGQVAEECGGDCGSAGGRAAALAVPRRVLGCGRRQVAGLHQDRGPDNLSGAVHRRGGRGAGVRRGGTGAAWGGGAGQLPTCRRGASRGSRFS
eukprot:SAG11_NODE_2118_length_3791_cov_2.251625_4_plen_245_part_00